MADNFDSRVSVEEVFDGDGRDEAMDALADGMDAEYAELHGTLAEEGPEEELICGICEGEFGYCDCEQENDDEWYDDSMDGDHDSAMTSCGWGTDEDYGCFEGGLDHYDEY